MMEKMLRGGAAPVLAILVGCSSHASPNMTPDADVDAGIETCMLPALTLRVGTLAGCSEPGFADGVRGIARYANSANVALDAGGVAYVADFDANRLRRTDLDGTTTTLVNRPEFQRPFGLAFASDGTLYVETDDDDSAHHSTTTGTIWRVDVATGDSSVVVRDIGRPRGLAALGDGRLAMTDQLHHVVELLDPSTGVVTVLAGSLDTPGHINGNGTAAAFAQPWDVVVVGGSLIVSDFDNNVLRQVTLAGDVTDFAGTGTPDHVDGPVATAALFQPKGVAADASGTIYVAEAGNHDVRQIQGGMVTTLAGSLQPGWLDADDPAQAQFYGVEGIDVSSDGTRVVVADGNNGDGSVFNHVRVIRP
jgi:DNA-binding beta-propeller fold protein YncE